MASPPPSGASVRARRGPSAALRLLARERVTAFSLVLVLAAALLAVVGVDLTWQPTAEGLALAGALVLAFGVAESLVLHFEIGDSAHTASLTELPLVLGLFWLDPALLVTARLAGALIGLAVVRRQSRSKLLFNLASIALEVVTASALFALLGSPDAQSVALASWLAVLASCVVASSLGCLAVQTVISLSTGQSQFRGVHVLLLNGAAMVFVNGTLALIAVRVIADDATVLLPVALVGLACTVGYRGHVRLRRRHERLSSLYSFVRHVSTTTAGDGTIRSVLDQTQQLLKAEQATLTLLVDDPERGRQLVTHSLDADGLLTTRRGSPADEDRAVQRCLEHGTPLLGQRGTRDRETAAHLARAGVRDCVLVAVPGDQDIAGTLSVGTRRGDHSTFEAADVTALEGVAIHAAVALRNARLLDRLTHESRHDLLTGLPNRTDFENRLREALAAHAPLAAVLFMDLDRFKDVNDTLGHHAGDQLLQQVALRLRAALPEDSTVARLGGDEFAVILPGATTGSAVTVAARLQQVLEQPVGIEGMSVDVGVSIGVAVAPQHGTDAGVLMRRADIAMYAAKAQHGTAVYDADRDDTSTSRLALVAQLRQALAEDQFALHFQPQVNARTGEADRFEALIRWYSPTRGTVRPDEFIPVAERAGLLQAITEWVLTTALDELVLWREATGAELGVAVNLSPRNLLDPLLAVHVRRLLDLRGLPPQSLTLEITEGTIMAEPERARATLEQLRSTGVRLSIDDFGTGYSSLSYLKDLPVHEVKIDKSFVLGLAEDRQDQAIVQAVVQLAGGLSLEVVAEGVEDQASLEWLTELGCDAVQGYHLSRPLPADRVLDYLRRGPDPVDRVLTDSVVVPYPRVDA